MKIAVFATGWNGEYLRDMYHGLENSQKEFHDSIHLYASFGRLGSGDSFNKSEFDFFELADMEAYDGFLYPSTTIKEGDVKQRLLERFNHLRSVDSSFDIKVSKIDDAIIFI